MIKNRKQYAVLKRQLTEIEREISEYSNLENTPSSSLDEIQVQVLKGQMFEIREEMQEFEALLASDEPIVIDGIEGITKAIINARIISGLTQKELSEKLGIQQQQIQRYEMDEYYKTSLERVIQICQILDIRVQFIINKEINTKKQTKVSEFLLPDDVEKSSIDMAIENMKYSCSLFN